MVSPMCTNDMSRLLWLPRLSKRLWLRLLFVLLAGMAGSGYAVSASLKSEVKTQTVVDGETVLLYIIGEDLRGYPDTSALNRRFDIVGSRRQESQFVDNGVVKSRFTMLLELLPKHLGVSDIPAFEVDGQRSDKIAIEVVQRGTPGVVPRDNVFAEVSIDNPTPYVQAQAILSLHVFDDGSLAAAEPEVPDVADMQIEQIPGNPQRLETRDGVEYRVHTWRYALFPQRSGSYDIPRIKVVANVKDAGYGGNLILRNSPTRRINFRSDSIQLDVRPRPSQSKSAWWLPVKQLDLKQRWSSEPATSQVGEPLTYSVILTTSGSTSTQLPEIKLPPVDGLKVYPDIPELASQPGDDGVISRRTDKWSIIPQRAGTVTLPEYRLYWWDTVADRERVTVIPAKQFTVTGGGATDNAADSSTGNAADTPAGMTTGTDVSADIVPELPEATPASLGSQIMPTRTNLWAWVAAILMVGWMTTLSAWLISARRNRSQSQKSTDKQGDRVAGRALEQQAMRELSALSAGSDRSRYLGGLMDWAGARWPDHSPVSLVEIGRRLDNNDLSNLLRQLESSIYSERMTEISLGKVHNALREAIAIVDNNNDNRNKGATSKRRSRDQLPEL